MLNWFQLFLADFSLKWQIEPFWVSYSWTFTNNRPVNDGFFNVSVEDFSLHQVPFSISNKLSKA